MQYLDLYPNYWLNRLSADSKTPKRFEQFKNVLKDLKFDLNDPKLNIALIAKQLGFEIKTARFNTNERTEYHHPKEILLNQYLAANQKTNAIAKQLTKYLLGNDQNKDLQYMQQLKQKKLIKQSDLDICNLVIETNETVVNQFAIRLLLPKKLLLEQIKYLCDQKQYQINQLFNYQIEDLITRGAELNKVTRNCYRLRIETCHCFVNQI